MKTKIIYQISILICIILFSTKASFGCDFVNVPESMLPAITWYSRVEIFIPNQAVDGGLMGFKIIKMYVPSNSIKEIYFRSRVPYSGYYVVIIPEHGFLNSMKKNEFSEYKKVNVEFINFSNPIQEFLKSATESNDFNYPQQIMLPQGQYYSTKLNEFLEKGFIISESENSFSYFRQANWRLEIEPKRLVINVVEEYFDTSFKMAIFMKEIPTIESMARSLTEFKELKKIKAQQMHRRGK